MKPKQITDISYDTASYKKPSSQCPQTQKRKWACGHFELCPWYAVLGVKSNFLLLSESLQMFHAVSLGWVILWWLHQCTATAFLILLKVNWFLHNKKNAQLREHAVSKPHFCLLTQPARNHITRKVQEVRYTSSTMSPVEETVSPYYFLCAKIINTQHQISIWKNTLKLSEDGTVPPCELAWF